MAFRSPLLRFIIVRGFTISFIIIILFQVLSYFNRGNNVPSKDLHPQQIFEEKLRQKFSRADKGLSDDERVERIKLVNNRSDKEVNWTRIFLATYKTKSVILNDRDLQTVYKFRSKEEPQGLPQQTIEIFEETTVFDKPKYCSSSRIFHPQCPFSNCRWTCGTPSTNWEKFRRASIFHYADIKQDEMRHKLVRRSYNDIWILWIDEANKEIKDLNKYRFNWTLSFRQDSEVSIGSYGILIKRKKQKKSSDNNSDLLQILSEANIQVSDLALEQRILTSYRLRRKQALWFVSNCKPKNRWTYYQKLKQLYPIEAFGSCVENQCARNERCEFDQLHLGLFYLAFESEKCTDYITEKFWRALYYGLIPIVHGPAKQSYHDLGIPASAYIHVDDFSSVKALADHLHQISNNYLHYRKYFQWLNEYDVFYDINEHEPIRMCELCMRLNMQDSRDHSFYTNVHKWHRDGC